MTSQNVLLVTYVVLVCVVLVMFLERIRNRRKRIEVYIKEPRVKIMFNPFTERYMWCRLNPESRVWDWKEEASEEDTVFWLALSDLTQKVGVAPSAWKDLCARRKPFAKEFLQDPIYGAAGMKDEEDDKPN